MQCMVSLLFQKVHFPDRVTDDYQETIGASAPGGIVRLAESLAGKEMEVRLGDNGPSRSPCGLAPDLGPMAGRVDRSSLIGFSS